MAKSVPSMPRKGFRFDPTDEELVCYYLRNRVQKNIRGDQYTPPIIHDDIDLYAAHPRILFDMYGQEDDDIYNEVDDSSCNYLYFFAQLKKKHGNGSRINRTVVDGENNKDVIGTWKGQSVGTKIKDPKTGEIAGLNKALSFETSKVRESSSSSKKRKNDIDDEEAAACSYIMHEYSLLGTDSSCVLCKIRRKYKKDQINNRKKIKSSMATATCEEEEEEEEEEEDQEESCSGKRGEVDNENVQYIQAPVLDCGDSSYAQRSKPDELIAEDNLFLTEFEIDELLQDIQSGDTVQVIPEEDQYLTDFAMDELLQQPETVQVIPEEDQSLTDFEMDELLQQAMNKQQC